MVKDPVQAMLAAEVDPAAGVLDVAGKRHSTAGERGHLQTLVAVRFEVAPWNDLVLATRKWKAHAQAFEVGVNAVENAARRRRRDGQAGGRTAQQKGVATADAGVDLQQDTGPAGRFALAYRLAGGRTRVERELFGREAYYWIVWATHDNDDRHGSPPVRNPARTIKKVSRPDGCPTRSPQGVIRCCVSGSKKAARLKSQHSPRRS